MDPIGSFSGLASGIQWRDMIDQIMRAEVSRRLDPLTSQVSAQQKRRDAWNSFNSLVGKLSGAVQALRDGNAFSTFRTTVSGSGTRTLLTATAASTAAPGSYGVEVVSLARSEKLSGAVVSATDTALGLAGDFFVNGRRVEIGAADTLTSVRDKINAVNSGSSPSGVTATILTTGTNEHRLVLTSDHTGARGIELVDGASGALQGLGILDGTLAQNTAPGDPSRTQTQRLASTSTPLGSVLGLPSPPAQTTIEIDGRKIEVDLENDTLLSLMNRINAEGGSASIVEESVGGRTMHRLTVGGNVMADGAAADPAASQRVVELLGFQQGGRASPIAAGADAHIRIDGFDVTRRSNTISDALAGVTLSLQQAEPGTTLQVDVARDTDATVAAVQRFASAYNEIVAFVDQQRQADAPLRGSSTLRTMMSSMTGVMLGGVQGLSASNPYTHTSIAGVALTKTGTLEVDAERLRSALTTNPQDIRALFSTAGVASDAEVSFVSSTDRTTPGSYALEITAAATRAAHSGTVWSSPGYTASDGVSDTLTITDSFSGLTESLVVPDGRTLDEVVSDLNQLFESKGMRLTAANEGGALRIESQEYGSGAGFTLSGSAAAGLGLPESSFAGTDVAGTIGGLAATGKGQVLTGVAGGATEGLAVRFTGSAARSAGTVDLVLGVGGMMQRVVDPITRSGDGVVRMQLDSIDSSIESLNRRADDVEARLELRRESMIRQFARMEEAMGRLQSQGTWLAQQIQALQPRDR